MVQSADGFKMVKIRNFQALFEGLNNNDNGSSENKIPSKEAQYPSGGEPMSDVSMSKGSINESLSGSNPELLTMNLKISNINR